MGERDASWPRQKDVSTRRRDVLDFPEVIFDRILHYLDPCDVKNLSFSSCRLLFAIENVQKWAPRLYVLSANSTCQVNKAVRTIPETYPGSYLTSFNEPAHNAEAISLNCSPSSLPTYAEAQIADWRYAFDIRKKRHETLLLYGPRHSEERQLWLCPHRACLSGDIVELIRQQPEPSPLPSTYSTIPMLCPFPKCSLWARHALIATQTTPLTYELCSTIRVYRSQCASVKDIPQFLQSEQFRRQLRRATVELDVPMCWHLRLGSKVVLDKYDFDIVLEASQRHVADDQLLELKQAIDQRHCQHCLYLQTYTSWGFVARYTQHSGRIWLDIEMMLCRPVTESRHVLEDIRQLSTCSTLTNWWGNRHWLLHSAGEWDRSRFVSQWAAWAEVVAEDGFDWRVQLPPAFLKQPNRGLLDFPLKNVVTRSGMSSLKVDPSKRSEAFLKFKDGVAVSACEVAGDAQQRRVSETTKTRCAR